MNLVYLLLSPAADDATHLATLAAITRRLRDPAVLAALRAAPSSAALQSIFAA